MRLMSDVPIGMFLSGGVDSSAIAALMKRMLPGPVKSYAVGYREAEYSELAYAVQVSRAIGTEHREVVIGKSEFFDALPKLIWHEDEPIVWPSSVPLYFVAKLAHERVKVVLTGEGSDETLAGYTRYAFTLKNAAWDRIYRSIVPGALRRTIRGSLANSTLISATTRRKLSHTFLARNGNSWASFYFDNFFSAFDERDQAGLLSDEILRKTQTDRIAYTHNILFDFAVARRQKVESGHLHSNE